jgi:hypothetical protein
VNFFHGGVNFFHGGGEGRNAAPQHRDAALRHGLILRCGIAKPLFLLTFSG